MYFNGHLSLIRCCFLFAALFSIINCSIITRSSAETLISHGISTFGELKYNAGFPHFDYVNPNAPKGGEISIWGFGSFDSMHPYSTKGRAGRLSSIFFETCWKVLPTSQIQLMD